MPFTGAVPQVIDQCICTFSIHESLCIRDHRAVEQCDTSLIGFDHQNCFHCSHHLPECISPSRSTVSKAGNGVTVFCSLYLGKHNRLTFTLHSYSRGCLSLKQTVGIKSAFDFCCDGLKKNLFGFSIWYFIYSSLALLYGLESRLSWAGRSQKMRIIFMKLFIRMPPLVSGRWNDTGVKVFFSTSLSIFPFSFRQLYKPEGSAQ